MRGREERQRHPLARVIEHAALTTHNDPERTGAATMATPARVIA
jgi:hypothetical protein